MMIVQFNCKYDRFNPGERANYSDEQAQRLIEDKIAVVVKPEPRKVVVKG